jgi:hypothetical protein
MADNDRELRLKVVMDKTVLTSGLKDIKSGFDTIKSTAKDTFSSMLSGARGAIDMWSQLAQVSELQKARMQEVRREATQASFKMRGYDNTIKALKEDIVRMRQSEKDNIADIRKKAQQLDKAQEEVEKYKNQLERAEEEIRRLEEAERQAEEGSKTFGDVVKNLTGAWQDFNSGNFESAFRKITNAGKGLFILMPKWVKATGALIFAIDKLRKAGEQRFFTGLSDIGDFFSPLVSGVVNFGRKAFNAFESITGSNFSFTGIINTGVEFEDTMARAGAICNATGKDLEDLTDKAREMGATTRYNATQSAEAIAQMGQQGWSKTAIEKGIEHVLNLATVGNIDLARSAEIVTNGLNAYKMNAGEAQKYVDILAQTSVKSGTNVEQLGEALENCATTANALGIDVEDTAIAIGLMGKSYCSVMEKSVA